MSSVQSKSRPTSLFPTSSPFARQMAPRADPVTGPLLRVLIAVVTSLCLIGSGCQMMDDSLVEEPELESEEQAVAAGAMVFGGFLVGTPPGWALLAVGATASGVALYIAYKRNQGPTHVFEIDGVTYNTTCPQSVFVAFREAKRIACDTIGNEEIRKCYWQDSCETMMAKQVANQACLNARVRFAARCYGNNLENAGHAHQIGLFSKSIARCGGFACAKGCLSCGVGAGVQALFREDYIGDTAPAESGWPGAHMCLPGQAPCRPRYLEPMVPECQPNFSCQPTCSALVQVQHPGWSAECSHYGGTELSNMLVAAGEQNWMGPDTNDFYNHLGATADCHGCFARAPGH